MTGKCGTTVRTSGERCVVSGSGDFQELPGLQEIAEVVHSHFNSNKEGRCHHHNASQMIAELIY